MVELRRLKSSPLVTAGGCRACSLASVWMLEAGIDIL